MGLKYKGNEVLVVEFDPGLRGLLGTGTNTLMCNDLI